MTAPSPTRLPATPGPVIAAAVLLYVCAVVIIAVVTGPRSARQYFQRRAVAVG